MRVKKTWGLPLNLSSHTCQNWVTKPCAFAFSGREALPADHLENAQDAQKWLPQAPSTPKLCLPRWRHWWTINWRQYWKRKAFQSRAPKQLCNRGSSIVSLMHDSFTIRSLYPKKPWGMRLLWLSSSSHFISRWISWPCYIPFQELYSYGNNNDIEGFSRLRSLVNNPDLDPAGLSPSPSTARMYPNNSTSAPNHYQHSFSSSTRPGSHNTAPNVNGTGPSIHGLELSHCYSAHRSLGPPQFKASPFFSILEPLSPLLDCKGALG